MRSFAILFILIVSFNPIETFAQKKKKGIEYKYDVNALIKAENIIWYGVDFSKAKMTDPVKVYESSLVKNKHIPSWISTLNLKFSDDYVKKWFKNRNYSSDLASVQKLFLSIDENNVVVANDYNIPIDSIAPFIEAYSLPQTNGVGFVLIVENLNKPSRYVTGYFVFFDIESRQVLYANKMKGNPGSRYGFSQYWKNGMYELYAYFFGKYLKRLLKE